MEYFIVLSLTIFTARLVSSVPRNVGGSRLYFSPSSSDDFKTTPIIELTRSNARYILLSQSCNIVFATDHAANMLDASKSSFLRQVAQRVAGRFRDDQDILVSHALFDTSREDTMRRENPFYQNLDKILRPSLGSAGPITILNYGRKVGKSRRPRIYRASPAFERVLESTTDVETASEKIVGWVKQKCPRAHANPFEAEHDLSVIFKTNKTLAILANGFDVSKDMVSWVRMYCKDYPLKEHGNKVTVLDARKTTLKQFLCLHAFGGRPLILKNAVENWPAMKKWKPNGSWVKKMSSAKLSADIGVESGWGGTSLNSEEYLAYMMQNENERRSNKSVEDIPDSDVLPGPPWSSLYAYTHQHTRLKAKSNNAKAPKFVADIMWEDFKAPKIFNQQNWFRFMGECHKMMTVTFWSTEGARQSNHQDDFGSSKWQAQIYGRKKWIMHPPEESEKLYNGLVDPFEPDLERYPLYRDVKRVEFVLEEGDVLFWSAGWWHATLALENSLAVAQNILNEHNYMEFRRTSRKACKPDGSHGIYSPWCACFRRTYGKWDDLYQNWLNDIKVMVQASKDGKDIETEINNYKFEKFEEDKRLEDPAASTPEEDDVAAKHSHPGLKSSIANVLQTVNDDVAHFHEYDMFPIDTARESKVDGDYRWEL